MKHLSQLRNSSDMLRRGFRETHEADPRAVGFLLGMLQFAGGVFLCFPFARFVPPFIELFKHLPSGLWAAYFMLSGFLIVAAACLPGDGTCIGNHSCLSVRYLFAVWSFANWVFLSSTCLFSIMYLLSKREETIIYGIAMAFYPVLTLAAVWKIKRLQTMERLAQLERVEQSEHVERLRERAHEISRRHMQQLQAGAQRQRAA